MFYYTLHKREDTPTTTTISVFGRVPEFNGDSEEFDLYLEKRWLAADYVAKTNNSNILVSTLAERTYAFLRTLLSPKAVPECSIKT